MTTGKTGEIQNKGAQKPKENKTGEIQNKSSYVVAVNFYSKDKVRKKYEKGQDVSGFPKERLESLVKRGLVEKK